jgi:predicted small lipoprotein YifL
MTIRATLPPAVALAALFALSACGEKAPPRQEAAPPPLETATTETPPADAAPGGQAYPDRVYYGDTHVHTGWSADAGMDGAITTPDDAYRFALGETVTSNTGQDARLTRPYDWFLVSDHSDGMGVINEIVAENPELMADPVLKGWAEALQGTEEDAAAAKSELIVMQAEGRLPAAAMDPKWMVSAWEQTIEAAEKYYAPGQFTTFIAYEWTVNSDGGDNLHRNVIFRDGAERAMQVRPLTTFETQDPEKLWEWMAQYEATTGGRVHAIPHNGNMSNGRMFEEQRFDGSPMTPEWASQREKYERLYEVSQIKGQSESHPFLSPGDEFAAWDLWDRGNLILNPKPGGDDDYQYEYWREALKKGVRLEDELGTNPFKYGANAATDTHTGLSTADEDNFFGKFKTIEPRAGRWSFPLLTGPTDTYMGWEQAASGIMGVWASENTREAIWDAMYRRETFATTGPRMTLRFFGGFDFGEGDVEGDFVARGYQAGVPMGGTLTAAPPGDAPSFMVAASKDPEGANLDRIQVIKGWVDATGESQEKIYNVAWAGDRQPGDDGNLPAVGNTVNVDTATYENSIGAPELRGVFRDPDFDAARAAVYYVRVLEIPTPRWTLYDKVRFGAEMDEDVPLVHQERAFSSPIWYVP